MLVIKITLFSSEERINIVNKALFKDLRLIKKKYLLFLLVLLQLIL